MTRPRITLTDDEEHRQITVIGILIFLYGSLMACTIFTIITASMLIPLGSTTPPETVVIFALQATAVLLTTYTIYMAWNKLTTDATQRVTVQ